MNLWVNRLRQLAPLAVALFFFACEDETSLNGFKNPNQKFKGKYAEIPLTTSNLLLDNIRTSNYLFQNEYSRFLVGQYTDPEFGTIRSHAVSQFFTASATKLPEGAVVDGVSIELAFDLYLYGATTTSTQTISIYPVVNPIPSSMEKTAYSDTEIPWNESSLIAEKQIEINPGLFDDYIDLNTNATTDDDTTVVMKFDVPQDNPFYTQLVSSYMGYSTNPLDTVFVTFPEFSTAFPGLAFVSSETNNMIMGFNTNSPSRVVIHYHVVNSSGTVTNLTQSLLFGFTGLFSYNKIETERIGDLAGLTPYADQPTSDGNRYIQSGTGLVTKVNIDPFFNYLETNNLQDIQINSAQLVIDGVAVSEFAPPRGLALRVLNDDNHLRKRVPADEVHDRDSIFFTGLVNPDFEILTGNARAAIFDDDSVYYAVADNGSPVALNYDSEKKRYSGFLTLLFQRLYKQKDEATRLHNFALYPTDPSVTNLGAKSVNRVIFPSDKVSLRIYYTEPTVKQQD